MTRHMVNDIECDQIDIDLGRSLRLFSTEMKHDTPRVLLENKRPEQEVLVRQAKDSVDALRHGDYNLLSNCFTQQWQAKFRAAPTEEHAAIERMIDDLSLSGAKLVGAGNGGYILVCDPGICYVGEKWTERELCFALDMFGSVIL